MSIERVKKYLEQWGLEQNVLELDQSSATVELAAQALRCEPERIAKTLSLEQGAGCMLIVTAGDAKINNGKFKRTFGFKPRLLGSQQVQERVGHAVGGVCPFAVPEQVAVYLDRSLQRFATVFPACGSSNSAIELTLAQLDEASRSKGWVDVCTGWEDQ